jgi:hypothetical protein
VIESRDLWLTVPSVKIDPPDTLVIVREEWGGTTTANQPQLWETTQRGWLTGITVAQKGNTEASGEPAGRIKTTATKIADIPPGGNDLIEFGKQYVLEGDFPLGTSKGKLVVQADQLAEAVSFGFEIRSRILRWWLFVPLIGGLGVGFVTRHWLQSKLALNQERQKSFALIEIIEEALRRNTDGSFAVKAKEARENAENAARKSKTEDVKADTDAARTSFQQALDALQKRRAELDQNIAKLLALVRAGWRVPDALQAELAKVKSALEKGLPGLDSNNVDGATTELDNVRMPLGKSAGIVGRTWLAALDHLDAALDASAPLLGADAAVQLKSAAKSIPDSLANALDQLEADPKASVELLQPVLAKLHAGTAHIENLLANAKNIVVRQINGWSATLEVVKLPKPDLWEKWMADAGSFATALREAAGDPVQRLERLTFRAKSLLSDLKNALIGQVRDVDQNTVIALLQAGKYPEAVAKVAELNSVSRGAVAQPEGRLMGGEERGVPAVPASARAGTVAFVASSASTPSLVYGFTAPPSGGLPSLAVLAAMSRRTVEATGALLSLVYAVLIAGAGYFLFADKWVGTPLDFAVVFFWAFATDVGADAATTAAKGLKRD